MINEKRTDLNFLEEFQKFIKASQKGKRTKQNGTKILKGSVSKLEVTYKTLKDGGGSNSCLHDVVKEQTKNYPSGYII